MRNGSKTKQWKNRILGLAEKRADEFRFNPLNYRRHPKLQREFLRTMLGGVGWVTGVLENERTGNLIDGHARIEEALKDNPKQKIPYIRVSLSLAEEKAIIATLDPLSAMAEHDDEALTRLLDETIAASPEIADLLLTLHERAEATAPAEHGDRTDIAGELARAWKTRTGQLWEISSAHSSQQRHRLLIGDCRSPEDMQRLMGGQVAAVAVSSPPYGVGKAYEEKGIEAWFATIRPAIKLLCKFAHVVGWNVGDLLITGSQYIEPTFAYSVTMFAECGFRPLWIRIWQKQGANFAIKPYHLVTTKPMQEYEWLGAFVDGNGDQWTSDELPTSKDYVLAFAGPNNQFRRRLTAAERRAWGYAGVWEINTVSVNDAHPAMFPVELPSRIIKMHSDRGDVVLDSFAGSLSTMDAAEQCGRICYAMEIEPTFAAVGLQRMKDAGLECRRAK